MAKFDQRGQKVHTQINANTVNFNTTPVEDAQNLYFQSLNAIVGKSYLKAKDGFEKAIALGMQTPDLYYYLVIAIVGGKRARLLPLSVIKQIEDYLQRAIELDNNCSHAFLLWALIKYDYYVMNRLYEKPPNVSWLALQGKATKEDRILEILGHISAPGNAIWESLNHQ